MVGKPNGSPLLYRGTGLITDPDNPLVLPVLKAASSAYCHTPSQPIVEYPHATGLFLFNDFKICVWLVHVT